MFVQSGPRMQHPPMRKAHFLYTMRQEMKILSGVIIPEFLFDARVALRQPNLSSIPLLQYKAKTRASVYVLVDSMTPFVLHALSALPTSRPSCRTRSRDFSAG